VRDRACSSTGILFAINSVESGSGNGTVRMFAPPGSQSERHVIMVIALSFVVIVSPFLYTVLLMSRLSTATKVLVGSVAFVVLMGLPILAFLFKLDFGLS
jgi:hypothetical protein